MKRVVEKLKEEGEVYWRVICGEDGLEMGTEKRLLVVVETDKACVVIEEKVLGKREGVVVIEDEGRREDFMKKGVVVYMEG